MTVTLYMLRFFLGTYIYVFDKSIYEFFLYFFIKKNGRSFKLNS